VAVAALLLQGAGNLEERSERGDSREAAEPVFEGLRGVPLRLIGEAAPAVVTSVLQKTSAPPRFLDKDSDRSLE
jgi:hypothetical protein